MLCLRHWEWNKAKNVNIMLYRLITWGMETMERKELFEWAKEIYGTEPDYPWNDWNCVLRHKNNKKWFALVVEVNARKRLMS